MIRYRTTRQIGFFADYDELYWNATGTGWTFPIDMAEARITLPEKVPFRQTAFYTGPQGARGKDATIVEQAARPHRVPHHASAAAAATASPSPPPGRRASSSRRPRRSGRDTGSADNRALVVAVVGLRLLLALLRLRLVARRPRSAGGTIIPLFGPPDGMSPAAARYVDRMGFDNAMLHRRHHRSRREGPSAHCRRATATSTLEKRGGRPRSRPRKRR